MNSNDIINFFGEKKMNLENDLFSVDAQINFYDMSLEELKSGKISTDLKKEFYEKYRITLTSQNYLNYVLTIHNDLYLLKQTKEKIKEDLKKSAYVINCFKYNQYILPFLIEFIKKELATYGKSKEIIIEVIEKIKIHNSKLTMNNKNLQTQDLYLILNMLNLGYEDIPSIYINNANWLKEIVKYYVEFFKDATEEECLNELNFCKIYNKEEELYIITYLLKYYQREIFDLINVLKNEDYYFDNELLYDIKEEYKKLIKMYLLVRKYYNDLLNEQSLDKEEEDNEISIEDKFIPKVNQLFYSSNSIDPSKCYFIKDLADIREVSLYTIQKLLQDFEQGQMKKVKNISHGFWELKEDQIRIVVKPIGNNNFSVMGTFIKKSDNDHSEYENIFKRPLASIDLNYSQMVEEIYKNYIAENARIGTRK